MYLPVHIEDDFPPPTGGDPGGGDMKRSGKVTVPLIPHFGFYDVVHLKRGFIRMNDLKMLYRIRSAIKDADDFRTFLACTPVSSANHDHFRADYLQKSLGIPVFCGPHKLFSKAKALSVVIPLPPQNTVFISHDEP